MHQKIVIRLKHKTSTSESGKERKCNKLMIKTISFHFPVELTFSISDLENIYEFTVLILYLTDDSILALPLLKDQMHHCSDCFILFLYFINSLW